MHRGVGLPSDRPGLESRGVKNPGSRGPGLVIATCLEDDGFPRVYHTTIRLIWAERTGCEGPWR